MNTIYMIYNPNLEEGFILSDLYTRFFDDIDEAYTYMLKMNTKLYHQVKCNNRYYNCDADYDDITTYLDESYNGGFTISEYSLA